MLVDHGVDRVRGRNEIPSSTGNCAINDEHQ